MRPVNPKLLALADAARRLLAPGLRGGVVRAVPEPPRHEGREELVSGRCPVCAKRHFLRLTVCKVPEERMPTLFQLLPVLAVLVAVLSLGLGGCAAVDGLYLSGVSGTVEREGERKTATVAVQFKPVQRRVFKNVLPLEKPAPTPAPTPNL